MSTQTLIVEGMSCDACVRHVTNALQAVPGVQSANVNLAEKKAQVVFDASSASVADLIVAVEEEGYTARPLVELIS